MSVVKTVSSGEPIRAGWANSLVHEINTKQGLRLRGKSAESTSLRPVRAVNDPAWQIRYSSGRASINAGQVFINGILIQGNQASYNQASSASNWKNASVYVPQSAEDLPIWYLTILCPKLVTEQNVSEVECLLVLSKKDDNPPSPPDVDDERDFILIKMNDIVENEIVQLVSGSIYLEQNQPSLVAGDGILIEELEDEETGTDVIKVSLYVSFIGEDGILITETWEPEEQEESTEGEETIPEHRLKVIKIGTTPISFIGVDGIQVHDELWAQDVSTEEDESNIWQHTRVISISGSSSHKISVVGTDPITVTETIEGDVTKYIISADFVTPDGLKLSFIGEDGITISEATSDSTRVVTIGNDTPSPKISIVGTDPITVTETIEGDVTKYLISSSNAYTVEQVTDYVPEVGQDGWVLTLYLPMLFGSNSGEVDAIFSFRQLMRFHEGKLQVSAQRALLPTGSWEPYMG